MTSTFNPQITPEMSRQERVSVILDEYRETPEGTALVEACDAYDRAYAAYDAACKRHATPAEMARLGTAYEETKRAVDAARQRYDAAK
jgi:hypothetical protein